ncbi:hypothetical protein N9045_00945 [bacterium]|nr:hypothetical protein [bacterium]
MSKYNLPVPRSRGFTNLDEFDLATARALASAGDSDADSNDPNIHDLIIHAAICRIAYTDNNTEEFNTQFNPTTGIVDCDIPDQLLDYLTRVEVGPKLEKYFSWLTNGVRNLRRDTLQFTIGADGTIAPGLQGIGLQIGYDASIERVDVLASATGDIDLDIWKVPADSWPGDASYSMTGSQPVTISSSNKNINIPIDTWNSELEYGDILVYNVNSALGISLVTITLYTCRYSTFESSQI